MPEKIWDKEVEIGGIVRTVTVENDPSLSGYVLRVDDKFDRAMSIYLEAEDFDKMNEVVKNNEVQLERAGESGD